MQLPASSTLPPFRVTVGSDDGGDGTAGGGTGSGSVMSQQEMASRLAVYVAAHGGTLVGVQFDGVGASSGFFIATSGTPLVAEQFTFAIDATTGVATVGGPFPWQL